MHRTLPHLVFLLLPLLALALGLLWSVGGTPEAPTAQPYPQSPRGDHIDTYHGVPVADPYRWLEELESPRTRRWIEAQDRLSRRSLEGLPIHGTLQARLGELSQIQVYGLPLSAGFSEETGETGETLFFTRGDGGRRHGVLYVQTGDEEPRVLVDVNREHGGAEDTVTLRGFVPSPDGRWVAYGLASGGQRWSRLRLREVATGRDLDDQLAGFFGAVGGIAWRQDGAGFYYGFHQPPAPGEGQSTTLGPQSLRYHHLGTPQRSDPTLFTPPDDSAWAVQPTVTEDGRYLVLAVRKGTEAGNRLLFRPLPEPPEQVAGTSRKQVAGTPEQVAGTWQAVAPAADANVTFLGNDDDRFWLWTDLGAPRGRIVAADLAASDPSRWQTLVPEDTAALTSVSMVGDRLVALYSVDARPVIRVHTLDGALQREAPLPAIAWTGAIAGRRTDRYGYYRLSGLTDPGTVYRLDLSTGRSTLWARGDLAFAPEDFVTRQVFFESRDGTRVPMFLAHRKGLEMDGQRPVMIYGYGAFAWPAVPWFQPEVVAWMEMGGIYALPNIRGGGEYGKAWYEAGIGRHKQNSIDDFVAAARWLVDHGYTGPRRLVARGGSASGPLVGAAITQQPELYGAALINIPALDMLRYAAFTGGRAWVEEFGAVEVREDFQALHAYSPYHNLQPGTCYPATLLTAGEKDETTVPSHAYKFTAALQAAQGCDRPILLQVAWGAGHSLGRNREESGEALARQLAFLARAVEIGAPGATP